jgi:hypothetical protein
MYGRRRAEDGGQRTEDGVVVRHMIKDNNGIIRKVRSEGKG